MALSEVNAVVNFVVKATSFIAQLQDGWYKGSVNLDTLQNKLSVLRARHGQWNEGLQRYGISEDKHLLLLLEESTKALENFQGKVEKLQKSSFRRFKKKVFPGQLLYLVERIFEIVDAGPQLLASRVANNDLLDRCSVQTPASLPFGPDSNYVPIADSILAVRNTLENSEGPRVVTVYGGPGTGKSSLMKYLAIHYQEEHKRLGADASFPHCVYYISCGQHAGKRVNQLLLQLLQNLGYGTRSVAVDGSTPSSSGLQEGDYIALPTNQMQLRSRLAEQKLLIMVDDLWEANVLLELLVPAKGVKYLVTSQIRDICSTAATIQITKPTLPECCQIMANYTNGLPKKGEFPDNIKSVAEDIIESLHRHPLSLANIGISINRSRATDIKQWNVIKKHIYLHLDENQCRTPVVSYDRQYSLPVSASMMLMVESLPAEEQRLLFVMALLEGPGLPESLVKYFYSCIQKDNFVVKYNNHEWCLEDKSLIQLTVRGERSYLNVHGLRMHYIRDRKSPEVRSVSSQILSPSTSGDQDVARKAIQQGDAEETLATVLSAVYYDKSFKDLVAGTLENQFRLINNGVIPRSLNIVTDRLDLVESAREKRGYIHDLVWLLNADYMHEVDDWQRQAHESAKKIIIKIVSQGKLEDKSMAQLLRLPQTTSAACRALSALCPFHSVDFYERKLAFSEACPETMQTLLDLFQNDAMSMKERAGVITSLLVVLDYESKDYIRTFATKYGKLLEMKSDHIIRHAFEDFAGSWCFRRGIVAMADSDEILKTFIAILVDLGNSELRESDKFISGSSLESLAQLCKDRDLSLKIAAFPEALQMLLHFFLSDDLSDDYSYGFLRPNAGDALYRLSVVPENRTKVGSIEGVWNGLGGALTKLKDVWGATESEDRWNAERRARVAAGVLGSLALDKDLRAIIASLPGVQEALLFFQLIETSASIYQFISGNHPKVDLILLNSTRALITVYSEEPEDPSRAADVPPIEDVLNMVRSCCEGAPSMASSIIADKCYLSLYWTRVLAYMQMGCYAEALENLDLYLLPQMEMCSGRHSQFSICSHWEHSGEVSLYSPRVGPSHVLSDCRIFLQAMTKDYTGALQGANKRVEECASEYETELNLAERGVLKRLSGDLQEALDDLDAALDVKSGHYWLRRHEVLWQRGYVKYLMEDTVGAKDDAEAAQGYRDRCRRLDAVGLDVLCLHKIPVTYLGYSL